MRGSPLVQALFLLLVIIVVGYAGHHIIQDDTPNNDKLSSSDGNKVSNRSQDENGTHAMVDAEVELTFSSPPISYSLKEISGDKADKHPLFHCIAEKGTILENPSYHDVTIRSHDAMTYWLDVTWANEPPENTRHFVTITLSPNEGEPRSFSYFTSTQSLEETFDYSPATPHSPSLSHD